MCYTELSSKPQFKGICFFFFITNGVLSPQYSCRSCSGGLLLFFPFNLLYICTTVLYNSREKRSSTDMNEEIREFTNLMKAIGSADKYCICKLLPFCYRVPVYTKPHVTTGFKAVNVTDVLTHTHTQSTITIKYIFFGHVVALLELLSCKRSWLSNTNYLR